MARVVYALPISEIIGSIGGITYQRNGSGTIVRNKPVSVYKSSPLMQFNQINVSKANAAWRTLSGPQRNIWDGYGLLHEHINEWNVSRHVSGFQWFMSLNLNLLTWGKAIQTAPPPFEVIPLPEPYFITIDENAIIINFYDPFTSPRTESYVYMIRPSRSLTVDTRRNIYKICQFTPVAMSQLDITSYVESVFNLTWDSFYNSFEGVIVCHIKNGPYLDGLCSPYGSQRVIKPHPIIHSLKLLFDDIDNASGMIGGDATDLADWNAAFGAPAHPFTGIAVDGNEVTLTGGEDITVPDSLFSTNWDDYGHLISIIDTGCITHAENHAFGDMTIDNFGTILTTVKLPNLLTAGVGCFWDSVNSSLITCELPSLQVASDYCFGYQQNLTNLILYELLIAAEGCFSSCVGLTQMILSKIHTIGNSCFDSCFGILIFYLPMLDHLGSTSGDDSVFLFITGQNRTISLPAFFQTNDGGDPDGDIGYLDSNNSMTINYL